MLLLLVCQGHGFPRHSQGDGCQLGTPARFGRCRMLWQIHRRPIPEVMCETCNRYGPTYGSYRGLKPALVLTEVQHVKEVFIKQFENFFNRSMEFSTGEPLWDNMILHLPYDHWKAVRTIMGSTFTTAKMRGMILKLDVISKRLMSKIHLIAFIHFPPKRLVKFITELTGQVLKAKRGNLDEVVRNGTADILDLHLMAQRDDPNSILTDEMLASQAFLFILGSDNTAMTLDLTIYFLTLCPEAQERAHKEIRSVVENRATLDYEDLQKMKFLEASVLETLRLVPMAGFMDRVCRSKTVVAGQEIPEGMVVEVNFPYMQHNPEYFPEPEKYKPERFLKDGPPNELGAYMMFGQGPKNCVGKRLAVMNMQVMLANLLLRFKLEPTENTPKMPLKLKPGLQSSNITAEPIVLRFVPRTAEALG